jgi:DNA-binding LacI/PurR family transcriptional regulator
LIVDRPAQVLGIEPFFMQLVSGIEMALKNGFENNESTALMLQVTDDQRAEIQTYRNWWAERRVDGVIVVDLTENDPRVGVLEEIGLPAVALGFPQAGFTVPCVWSDDGAPMREVVGYLAALGHTRVARVAGPADLVHTVQRDLAFAEAATQYALAAAATVHTDYSGDSGARAARRLLSQRERPTALVFDNDVMALASMAAAQEMGITVPDQLSIVAWDDSALCRLVRPSVTAVNRDIPQHGVSAVAALEKLIRGERVGHCQTPVAVLNPRASTGRAPAV